MSEDDSKIKVFASDDNLKSLGELLSNDTSRKIITNLMEHQMYTNEIATKLDIRVSLVIHHLRKLEELGLLEIVNKKIKRKGEEHRFFKINSDLFILLNKTKTEIEEKGILKRIFKDGIKLTSIALATVSSHFYLSSLTIPMDPNYIQPQSGNSIITDLPFIIIIIGLSIWLIYEKRKKRVS